MRRRILRLISGAAFLLLLTLAGCGGGGGGGNGGGGDAGIEYTGLRTPARLDENNAEYFSTDAYQGGGMGNAMSGVAAVQAADSEQAGYSRILELTRTLETVILEVDVTAPPGVSVSGAIQQASDTIPGDCPGTTGSASYTIEYDDITGNFSGNFVFNSYCSEEVTLSGRATFSGNVDPIALVFKRFSITFDNLTASMASDSFTTRGDINYDFDASPLAADMDLLLKDNTTGDVYWVSYDLTLADGPNYVEIEMSGRYYDPDYGYVDIATPSPFVVYDGDERPSDGVLVITGDTAIGGGSTKARLTARSSTTYRVEADTDGDGSYDWDSGIQSWII